MNTFSYRFSPDALSGIITPSNSVYNFGTGDFSIEAWVKTLHGGPVLARKATGHGGFLLTLGLRKVILTCHEESSSNSIEGNTNVCDGRWHHVAAVRSGAASLLYVDGKALAVTTSSSGDKSPPLNVDCTDNLTIGTVEDTNETNSSFRGLLAEIRLWSAARTTEEVLSNQYYRLQSATLSSKLVGYWTGEFGYVADLSTCYGASTFKGSLSESEEGPPLLTVNHETFSTIFYGIYNITSTDENSQSPAKELAVTLGGFAILDKSKTIHKLTIEGTRLKWLTSDGNEFDADLRFMTFLHADDDQQFDGKFTKGDTTITVTGKLAPIKVGYGILLNVGTGLILACPKHEVGGQLQATLAEKDPDNRDYFCRESSTIVHMQSGLSLEAASSEVGSKILLANINIGNARQSWTVKGPNIILKDDPNLSLSVDGSGSLVLATTDANDEKQQWLNLQRSQLLFNGTGGVLVAGSETEVTVSSFTDGSPGQLWYFFQDALINQKTAKALTVDAASKADSILSLTRWSPNNTSQQFIFDGSQLVHKATNLIVGVKSLGSKPVLQEADTIGDGTLWSIDTAVTGKSSIILTRERRSVTATGSDDDEPVYVVAVSTADYFAAGTDDKVEIILESGTHSLPRTELNSKNNDAGTNPFERGQTDTFTLRHLPDIGTIERVTIYYGANNWLRNERWVVNEIVVTNKSRMVNSVFRILPFEMPSVATFGVWRYRYIGPNSGLCTMSLGMAPAEDAIGAKAGWDHTWISVLNKEGPPKKTWFDCAGGHKDTEGTEMGTCDRQDVVRMSTGYPYGPTRPLKEVYGNNRTDGVENAGVRADGRANWQGQCHQIANRYLWTCSPKTLIHNLPTDKQPRGYGLSVLVFGIYGLGFTEWIDKLAFGNVFDGSDDSIYGFVAPILKTVKQTRLLLARRLDLQHELLTATNSEPPPDGQAVRSFLKDLNDQGISVTMLGSVTNYTETQITELLKS